jgi:hypothetical protein
LSGERITVRTELNKDILTDAAEMGNRAFDKVLDTLVSAGCDAGLLGFVLRSDASELA